MPFLLGLGPLQEIGLKRTQKIAKSVRNGNIQRKKLYSSSLIWLIFAYYVVVVSCWVFLAFRMHTLVFHGLHLIIR